ncbi:hypothetical protein AMTRI_Chr04g248110 [Amborella trichopoda]
MKGTILQGTMRTQVGAGPLYCFDVGYITCPSLGDQNLPAYAIAAALPKMRPPSQ